MTDEELMREGMDIRLFTLLLLKKAGWIAATGIIAAVICAAAYLLKYVVYAPAREYEAVSRYYIDFTVDENGDRAYDYYNAATWNDVAASDPILDYTMSLLPEGYDKETVKNAVFCEQPSDYRIITTTITAGSAEEAGQIQRATEQSLIHYGQERVEFDKITVIMSSQAAPVTVDLHTVKAALLAGAAGCLAAFLWFVFRCTLDTSIYIEETFEKRYGRPVLGVILSDGGGQEERSRELLANYSRLCGGKQVLLPLPGKEAEAARAAETVREAMPGAGMTPPCTGRPEEYERCRAADGTILLVHAGRDDGKQIGRLLSQLEKQGIRVSGAVLYGVDGRLYRRYYRRWFGGKG